MAKYHINNKGEVKLCRAQIKCRFGGASGSENHFADKSEAEKKAQKDLSQRYGQVNNGVQKAKGSPGDKLIRGLRDRGYSVTHVTSIKSHSFGSGKPLTGPSQIDVLDEKPDPNLIRQIRNGQHRQFT